MSRKRTIKEIVLKVDRKIEEMKEAEFYRIDFPPPGEPFSLDAVFAQELSPSRVLALTNQMRHFFRIGATATLLFAIFFLLFNAPAYTQILKSNLFATESILEQHIVEEAPPEQELLVMSKDPIKQKQEFPELALAVTAPDNRLIIPAINKNIPIVEVSTESLAANDWTTLDAEILEALKNGVVHYPGTAEPGDKGNTFITGHSSYHFWDEGDYKDVFALLPELEVGDYIITYYNQQKFTYQITEKREVAPSEVDVLAQPDAHQITLMTCTPVGTNLKRLVLIGELV